MGHFGNSGFSSACHLQSADQCFDLAQTEVRLSERIVPFSSVKEQRAKNRYATRATRF
jgi:hypothetical protein